MGRLLCAITCYATYPPPHELPDMRQGKLERPARPRGNPSRLENGTHPYVRQRERFGIGEHPESESCQLWTTRHPASARPSRHSSFSGCAANSKQIGQRSPPQPTPRAPLHPQRCRRPGRSPISKHPRTRAVGRAPNSKQIGQWSPLHPAPCAPLRSQRCRRPRRSPISKHPRTRAIGRAAKPKHGRAPHPGRAPILKHPHPARPRHPAPTPRPPHARI